MSSNQSLKNKYKKTFVASPEEVLKNTLLKKAKGFVVEEVVEEFCVDDNGKMILNKKKGYYKRSGP